VGKDNTFDAGALAAPLEKPNGSLHASPLAISPGSGRASATRWKPCTRRGLHSSGLFLLNLKNKRFYTNAMPNYSVLFKTRADEDHQFFALRHFNATDAVNAGIGQFTYDEIKDGLPSDYTMEEQEGMFGARLSFFLYPVK
jgi:hypothetical protein